MFVASVVFLALVVVVAVDLDDSGALGDDVLRVALGAVALVPAILVGAAGIDAAHVVGATLVDISADKAIAFPSGVTGARVGTV